MKNGPALQGKISEIINIFNTNPKDRTEAEKAMLPAGLKSTEWFSSWGWREIDEIGEFDKASQALVKKHAFKLAYEEALSGIKRHQHPSALESPTTGSSGLTPSGHNAAALKDYAIQMGYIE